MNDQDIMAFLGTLTDTQKEKLLACTSEDELEQILDDYDIEIPDEMLEAIAGGRGRFVPTLLAGIIMLSGAGTMIASPSGGTIFEESTITAYAADWKKEAETAAKNGACAAIDKGLEALTSQIPYVGATLKGPLSNLIKDAFGLTPAKPMTNEELSAQISELAIQMRDMGTDIKAHVDAKTKQMIEEMQNQEVVSTYKKAMNDLSLCSNDQLKELSKLNDVDKNTGLPLYNDDEKLLILAMSINNGLTWRNGDSVMHYMDEVSGYMKGDNYISNKDFYTALCDSQYFQQKYMFYDDVQEDADTYITFMMTDYLATYAVIVQALKAQLNIIDAVKSGDKETFNPDNLSWDYRNLYNAFTSTTSQINERLEILKENLYGNDDPAAKSVMSVYEAFLQHDRVEYINYGDDSAVLEYGTRTIKNEGSIYASVLVNNYITDTAEKRALRLLIENAREKGQSIADYLSSHQNYVPADAKWLITDGTVRTVKTKDKGGGVGWKDEEYTQYVSAIDIRDPEAKQQDLPIKTFVRCTSSLGFTSTHYDTAKTYISNKCLTISKVFADETNPFGQMANNTYTIGSGTYRLGRNLVIDGSIVVKEGANVTIDLNGYKLNRSLSSAAAYGTVIVASKKSKVTIIDSNPNGGGTITGGFNKDQAGAMFIYEDAEVSLNNVTLEGNRANQRGGAILCCGTLNVYNCNFINNSASDGGAIYVQKSGRLKVTGGTTFKGNSSTKYGGGAIANHGRLYISGTNVFDGNTAKENGGAIWSTLSTSIKGATIINNKAGSYGGGISVDKVIEYTSDTCEISDCIIHNNEASVSGGGLHSHGEIRKGYVTNCQITDNKAGADGGGVKIGQNSNCYHFIVTFKGCTISGNHAKGDGGGINTWQGNGDYKCKVYFTDCVISDNSSDGWGGGYRTQANVKMTRCTIKNNFANKSGGGIYNHYCVELHDCLVTDNRVNDSGGGISTAEAKSGFGYSGNTYIDLYGSTRIENNYANGKESSIFEVGKKADVRVHDDAYIGPGYHVG